MPGGDRKVGRNVKRPAQKRYVAEHRVDKNARIRQARHARRVASDVERVAQMRVKRGTARASSEATRRRRLEFAAVGYEE